MGSDREVEERNVKDAIISPHSLVTAAAKSGIKGCDGSGEEIASLTWTVGSHFHFQFWMLLAVE